MSLKDLMLIINSKMETYGKVLSEIEFTWLLGDEKRKTSWFWWRRWLPRMTGGAGHFVGEPSSRKVFGGSPYSFLCVVLAPQRASLLCRKPKNHEECWVVNYAEVAEENDFGGLVCVERRWQRNVVAACSKDACELNKVILVCGLKSLNVEKTDGLWDVQ